MFLDSDASPLPTASSVHATRDVQSRGSIERKWFDGVTNGRHLLPECS